LWPKGAPSERRHAGAELQRFCNDRFRQQLAFYVGTFLPKSRPSAGLSDDKAW
jgi:hypothetical protein